MKFFKKIFLKKNWNFLIVKTFKHYCIIIFERKSFFWIFGFFCIWCSTKKETFFKKNHDFFHNFSEFFKDKKSRKIQRSKERNFVFLVENHLKTVFFKSFEDKENFTVFQTDFWKITDFCDFWDFLMKNLKSSEDNLSLPKSNKNCFDMIFEKKIFSWIFWFYGLKKF